MKTQNTVLDCGHEPSPHSDFTTGYGIQNNKKFCYECCAKNDLKAMEEDGRATLYLTKTDGQDTVSNWPGSLKFKAYVTVGRHNIAGKRYNAWFWVNGVRWYGVTYGDNTQICHCKKTKVTQ